MTSPSANDLREFVADVNSVRYTTPTWEAKADLESA